MSLLKHLEDVLALIAEQHNPRDALRRAEKLADEFSDIKPKNEMPSPEQLMGLPESEGESTVFRQTHQSTMTCPMRILFTLSTVILLLSGCTQEHESRPEEEWSSESVSESDLPPVAEQEIMDRRIKYCMTRFWGGERRNACITGYLAQPIAKPSSVE